MYVCPHKGNTRSRSHLRVASPRVTTGNYTTGSFTIIQALREVSLGEDAFYVIFTSENIVDESPGRIPIGAFLRKPLITTKVRNEFCHNLVLK